jgi:2'-5' RNA ligase
MPSAVIVRAHLPAGLERLRRRRVGNAAVGVPAHVTLLHPFVEPGDLSPTVRRRLAGVAARHAAFDYVQAAFAEWPDAFYVSVNPPEPFKRLYRDLQAAFPDWPIYGWSAADTLEFEPHITIADREGKLKPGVREDPVWSALPRPARAEAIDLIATRPDGRWRLVWRVPLGGSAGRRARPPHSALLASRP